MTKAQFLRPRNCMLPWLPESLRTIVMTDDKLDALMATVGDEAVAVGGVRRAFGKSAEAFLALSPDIFKYPAVFVQIRRVWDSYAKNYARLSMLVDILNPKAIRFAYWLGCEPEGIMRKLGNNGEDFIQFVRFGDG